LPEIPTDMNDAVYLVTVTYGERGDMLAELVRRCFAEQWLTKIVVINNASTSPLRDLLRDWLPKIVLVENDYNTGSAQAYSQGIAAALADGADYLLLMDDDNAPTSGCVPLLLAELKSLGQTNGFDRTAVSGFRPLLQPDVARGKPPPLPSSFLGFHIAQIHRKLWSRLRPQAADSVRIRITADLPFAAYGGLLAHRTLFERIGLPKAELILYEDDTEYTARIRAVGGTIRLFTRCLIDDLEQSWNTTGMADTSASRLIDAGANFRVYYNIRNRVWFDHRCFAKSQVVYYTNKLVYLSMVGFQSLRLKKLDRFRVILHAVRDGENARLGVHPDYPLLGGRPN
jgi:GT2 family glycosyltransferase